MKRRSHLLTLSLLAILVASPGCLFRSRRVPVRVVATYVKSASLDELVRIINTQAAAIKTLNATVDIDTSVGGATKGKITEYQQIRGYILVRKPEMLRMIGLFPIVRNRAFDMVSSGEGFKLWIPPKNKFIVGTNEVTQPSSNALENLRPSVIYDALLLQTIDAHDEIAVLENATQTVTEPNSKKQVEEPEYVVDVIRKGSNGWYLSRKVVFSRIDLLPHRQLIYDKNGYVATEARYENFKDYNGVVFPNEIDIWRPQEEYSIGLTLVKLTLNQPLTNEQFVLNQPPGAQVVRLNAATASNSQPSPSNGPQ